MKKRRRRYITLANAVNNYYKKRDFERGLRRVISSRQRLGWASVTTTTMTDVNHLPSGKPYARVPTWIKKRRINTGEKRSKFAL